MNVCDFGTILKKLRLSKSLTQQELGSKVGLSKAVVSKYENGLGFPTFDVLIKIAKYFGVTTDFLLGVERDKVLDISGLTDRQIQVVSSVIDEFKRGNNA